MYQKQIIDEYKKYRQVEFRELDISCSKNNAYCGDSCTVSVEMDQDIIVDISVKCNGCLLCVVSAHRMMSYVKNRDTLTIDIIMDRAINDMLDDDNASRINCIILPWETLKKTLHGAIRQKDETTDI